MWYYTSHYLSIEDNEWTHVSNDDYDKIMGDMLSEDNIDKYPDLAWAFQNPGEATKSYDLESELREFSKSYPDLVFVVTWYGEDQPDMWVMKVHDWKSLMKEAQVVFPEISLDELKPWSQ